MKVKELILRQISDVLLVNGGFLSSPGLYTGEMGLVLFFARYARYTQNDLYMDYAFGLIEKIQRRIHQDTPINYKHGLAGIGSAIEYIVQNSYFEADTDEILEDFDQRIYFTYNIPYLPVEDTVDIWYYIHWRLSGNSRQKDKVRQFILPQIEKAMRHHDTVMPAWPHLSRKDHAIVKDNQIDTYLNNKELGLQNGLAGWGLSLLTELDGDDSWTSLLPSNSKDAMSFKQTLINNL